MIQIANFGTRAVVRYKANKGPKGVEQGCLQMRLHYAIKVLSEITLGHPLHLVSVPEQNGYLLVQLLTLSFYSFSVLPFFFFSFSFFPFFFFFPPFPSFPFFFLSA